MVLQQLLIQNHLEIIEPLLDANNTLTNVSNHGQ